MTLHPLKTWNNAPFLARLLVTSCAALLAAALSMLLIAAKHEADEIGRDLRVALDKELDTLPTALAESVVLGDFASLQQTLNHYAARQLVRSVSFRDTSGATLASSVPAPLPQSPRWFHSMFGFKEVLGKAPVTVGGRRYGELTLTLSPRALADRLWRHLHQHLAILLLALAIDFIGIWLVLRAGLAPLKALEEGVNSLAGGRLDVHLDVRGSPELRHVIAAFNRMAIALNRSQQEIEAQRFRLNSIIEGTHAGTWEWNVQTDELLCNDRWAAMLGYRLDELGTPTAGTWDQLIHRADRPEAHQRLRRHLAGDTPYIECEMRLRHRDGHWLWVLARGRVGNRSPDGKPLWLFGTTQDISAAKDTQLALESLLAEHASLIRNLPVGVYKYRCDGHGMRGFTFASPALCAQLGRTEQDLLADPDALHRAVHPDDWAGFAAALAAAREAPGPLHWSGRIRRGADTRSVRMEATMEREPGGAMVCNGLLADITEQLRATEEQHRLSEALRQTSQPVLLLEPGLEITFVNQSAVGLLGYSQDELLGQPITMLTAEGSAHRTELLALYARAPEQGAWTGQVTRRARNGEDLPLLASISAVRSLGGEVVSYVVTYHDLRPILRKTDELIASEARFRLFFEQNSCVMLLIDPDSGTITSANHAAAGFYGYPQSDLVGMNIDQINTMRPEDIAVERHRALTAQRNYFNFMHRLASGEERVVEVYSTPSNFAGRPQLFSIVHDITERHRAEARAAAVLEEQQAVLQSEIVGIVRTRKREAVWVNQTFARMLGYAPEELMGRSTRIYYPDDASYEAFGKQAYPLIAARQVARIQARFRHKDGTLRWFDISGARLQSTDDEAVWALIDIEAVKLAEARLAESEHRFRALVEASAQIVWSCDAEGRAAHDSPSWRTYTGQSPGAALGTGYLDAIHPDDLAEVRARWRCALAAGAGFTAVYRLRHHSGEWRWNQARGIPIRNDLGELTGWVGMNTDIHEQEMAKQALEAAKSAAEAANVAKSRFLATMSHEIRTPMNGILGMAQLLLEQELEPAQRKDCIQTIYASGRSLLDLLNDILDLSKIEAGKMHIETAPLELRELVGEVRGLFAAAAERKSLLLEAKVNLPCGARYLGDHTRIRQMLANLVGNAIKFTEHGSVAIEVDELARGTAESTVRFSVRDTGIGIARDKQALLFQPFTQADNSTTRRFGGSGLGLSIVRTLADLMHGEVAVRSAPGLGSCFSFTVCLPHAPAPALQGPPGEDGARPAPPVRLAGRVLVVEDNEVNRKVINGLLAMLGVETLQAANGREGIDVVSGGTPVDLVLMDIQMPVCDGETATRAIRARERELGLPPVPVVALTADAYEEDRQRALDAGMDDFLAKPVDLAALRQVLARWLSRDGAQTPLPPAAPRALDEAGVAAAIGALLPRLARNKFDAVKQFKQLQEMVAGTPVQPDFDEVGKALDELRFDLAHERLRAIAQQHSWNTETV